VPRIGLAGSSGGASGRTLTGGHRFRGSERVRGMAASAPYAPPLMTTAPLVTQGATIAAGLTATYGAAHVRWDCPLLDPPFNSGSMQPKAASMAGAQQSSPYASVSFDFDGRYLDVELTAHATHKYRIWVNEQAATPDLVAFPTGTGTRQFLHLDFGAASRPTPRRITLEFEKSSATITVYGFRCAPTDLFSPPAPTPRVMLIGDSYARGEGGATSRAFGYARSLGRFMGWADFWHISTTYAGTGLVQANDPAIGAYGVRMAYDVLPHSPDLLIIQGSVNDRPHTGLVGAALTIYVRTFRNAYPDVPIIVTSPLFVATPLAADLTNAADMRTAAGALGVPFVDALTPAVFTGDTTAGDTTPNGSGNADWARNGGDKTHPSNAGAYALARYVSGLIAKPLGVIA
jgi:lysophospholipase L1-like esterase